MDLEISPEPEPSEHEAVARALERLLDPAATGAAAVYRSAWRLAGLRENAGSPGGD